MSVCTGVCVQGCTHVMKARMDYELSFFFFTVLLFISSETGSLTELYTQHVSHGSRTFLSLLSTLCYWHVRSCLAYKWVLEIQTQDLLSADANSHPHSLLKTVTLHLSTDIHLFPGSFCSWTLIAIILLSVL